MNSPRSVKAFAAVATVFAGLTLSACSTGSTERVQGIPSSPLSNTSDLVFQFRQQAAELREAARKLELEAQIHAQRQDQEQLNRKLDLAREMRAAADTADERAREYRRSMPHNQVY
ncbi:hypothetical protein [Candidatus Nitrospira bockiana]